jgi:recombination protein RecA
VGNQTRGKVVKNKVAPPFKMVDFDIVYGEGISREGSLLDIGIKHGVVQKSGTWFAYGDERLGQGQENAKQFLKENEEVRNLTGLDNPYECRSVLNSAPMPERLKGNRAY